MGTAGRAAKCLLTTATWSKANQLYKRAVWLTLPEPGNRRTPRIQLGKPTSLMLLGPMMQIPREVTRLLYNSLCRAFESIVISLSDLRLLLSLRSFPRALPLHLTSRSVWSSIFPGHYSQPLSTPQPSFMTAAQGPGEHAQHPPPSQAKEPRNCKRLHYKGFRSHTHTNTADLLAHRV